MPTTWLPYIYIYIYIHTNIYIHAYIYIYIYIYIVNVLSRLLLNCQWSHGYWCTWTHGTWYTVTQWWYQWTKPTSQARGIINFARSDSWYIECSNPIQVYGIIYIYIRTWLRDSELVKTKKSRIVLTAAVFMGICWKSEFVNHYMTSNRFLILKFYVIIWVLRTLRCCSLRKNENEKAPRGFSFLFAEFLIESVWN